MTTKAGMLPGDEFTFAEWKAAKGQPKTSPPMVNQAIANALAKLEEACREEGIPYLLVLGLREGELHLSDLGNQPQNVSHPLLLARSAVVDDPAHKMALMAHSLQSLDLSKLQL